MKTVLFAAGLGTRLRPLTERYAKPTIPFFEKTLLERSAELAVSSGFTDLIINHSYRSEDVLKAGRKLKVQSVQFSHEPGQPMGSGGALKIMRQSKLLKEDDDHIILINADELLFAQNHSWLKALVQDHQSSQRLATLAVIRNPEAGTKFGGVYADAKNRIFDIGKGLKHTDQPWHFIGVAVINKKLIDFLPDGESNFIYDAIVPNLKAEVSQVFPVDVKWYETGHVEDFKNANRDILHSFLSRDAFFHSKILADLGPDFIECASQLWINRKQEGRELLISKGVRGIIGLQTLDVLKKVLPSLTGDPVYVVSDLRPDFSLDFLPAVL